MWVDINEIAMFLKEKLPESVTEGTLDLQPLWEVIEGTPGIQQNACKVI